MIHSRNQTDTAVRLWGSLDKRELTILPSLQTVRTHVNRDVDYFTENSKLDMDRSVGEYHRILVLYNAMISSVLQSFLLPTGKRSATTSGSRRGGKNHRRNFSDGPLGMLEPIRSEELDHHQMKGYRGVKFIRESRTPALLNLLECFVALKESTGLERALLSSMFAMGTVDHRLLNDLVLEVENQFKLITVLKNLQDLDGNVLLLIRENVGLPPSMERLQSFILTEFDLMGFQREMNHESVWNLITVYMDKLHSLELLIIEELESSLSEDNKDCADSSLTDQANVDISELLENAFASNGNLQELENMPAAKVKTLLLEMMTASSRKPLSTTGSEIPTESLPMPQRVSNSNQRLVNDDNDDEKPVPSEWDINLYEIHFQKRIGRGTAGTTYLAKWSGQEVAVKVAAVLLNLWVLIFNFDQHY